MSGALRWCRSCRTSAGSSRPSPPGTWAAVPLVSSLLNALDRVLANLRGLPWSQVSVVTATSFARHRLVDRAGRAPHSPEASVAATLDSSSGLTSTGPLPNDPRFCLFDEVGQTFVGVRVVGRAVPGSGVERKPSLTAMSTVRDTPTCEMSSERRVGRLGRCIR